ncbi:MAG: hypothetical protein JXA72_13150 [Bacteroidales bacterium]|nr:hypothetical protein [Bacteroidales bacterium]
MKTNLFLILLLSLAILTGCKDDEDKDPVPENNYIGTLQMDYSRTFPEFSESVIMTVTLDKSGNVFISEPDQLTYDSGEDIIAVDGDQIKQQEAGTITITSLSGSYIETDGDGFLSVNASTLIDGTQITWGWDEELGWILAGNVPFSVEDPVESPMDFNIDDAVIGTNGSQIGATVQVPPFGSVTYKWALSLIPMNGK